MCCSAIKIGLSGIDIVGFFSQGGWMEGERKNKGVRDGER
jgi:hypothetical protein